MDDDGRRAAREGLEAMFSFSFSLLSLYSIHPSIHIYIHTPISFFCMSTHVKYVI